ncbi:heterokaryon incompatibility protein-domain-containing protein, partial [Leptodontidium sp. 2 PMI_412]
VPRRLIDEGTDQWEQVKLRLDSDVMSAAEYMTLSHRWANASVGKLTTINILQLVHMIPKNFLSCTFKEAIIMTRALGFKFLWIDSLCIIQDSIEDRATESALMHSIYGNSSYNISAIASSSSSEGLLLRKSVYTPIRVNILIDGTETAHIVRMHDTWNEFVTSSPLNIRGWVCQERLLSLRVLHYSNHQIFWECGQLSASEDWLDGVPPRPVPKIDPFYPKYILPHIIWAKVVKLYTRATLTYSTDRLVAISGIAAQFQPKIRSKYLAGLWEFSIATDLLWRVENTDDLETVYPKRELQARPSEYIAPTWSWASINTAV